MTRSGFLAKDTFRCYVKCIHAMNIGSIKNLWVILSGPRCYEGLCSSPSLVRVPFVSLFKDLENAAYKYMAFSILLD